MSRFRKEHSSTKLKVTAGLPVARSFSGVANPKFFWGGEIFDFRRATVVLFVTSFLKIKITKNLGGISRGPPWLRLRDHSFLFSNTFAFPSDVI